LDPFLKENQERVSSIVVTPSIFSSSGSLEFFTMVHQVSPSVSSFSECLELFSEFLQTFVGPRDIISFAVFDVCPPLKPIYLFFLSLGVIPSE